MIQIDHVVYAVRDLHEAAERFRDVYGLGSVAGGRHAGWGTGNRIVPLGDQYVELISVLDPKEAAETAFGRTMLSFLEGGDRPWTVVCRTDELDDIASRLALEVSEGSRTRPDGRVIAWRGAGLDDARRGPHQPFFIEWTLSTPDLYPGRSPADHGVEPLGISWVEVTGDAGELRTWLGGADLPLRVADGPPSVRSFAVATVDREVIVS
jgi:hypothetical protein